MKARNARLALLIAALASLALTTGAGMRWNAAMVMDPCAEAASVSSEDSLEAVDPFSLEAVDPCTSTE